MGRYFCEQCCDDYSKPGTCEIHGEPLVKMEEEENEESSMFNEEEFN